MIALSNHKRIENFRKFVCDIAESGNSIDQRTTSELMSEALKAEREIQQVLPYVKWPARVISLLPFTAPFVVLGAESFESMKHRDKRKNLIGSILLLIMFCDLLRHVCALSNKVEGSSSWISLDSKKQLKHVVIISAP